MLAVRSVTELVVGANSLFGCASMSAFIRHCSEEGLVVSFAGERKAQELIDSGIDALVVLGNHATEVLRVRARPFRLPSSLDRFRPRQRSSSAMTTMRSPPPSRAT